MKNYVRLVKARLHNIYLQFKLDERENGYLNQTLVIWAIVELKKNSAWEDWIKEIILKDVKYSIISFL